MKTQKRIVVIPARLESQRLPNKVILPSKNYKTLIEEVYQKARKIATVDGILLAVNDYKLYQICSSFAYDREIMVVPDAKNGTHRTIMAIEQMGLKEKATICNIQADMPEFDVDSIPDLFYAAEQSKCVVTAHHKVSAQDCPPSDFKRVKMVLSNNKRISRVIYCSRERVPHNASEFNIHQGVYVFGTHMIPKLMYSTESYNHSESLEQLAWLEKGVCVLSAECHPCVSIDTKEDYEYYLGREWTKPSQS